MAKKMRDAAKELLWREALKRFAQSSSSVREFCRQFGLRLFNIACWSLVISSVSGLIRAAARRGMFARFGRAFVAAPALRLPPGWVG